MIEDVILHHSIVVQLRSMVLRRRNVGTGKSVSHVAEFFFFVVVVLGAEQVEHNVCDIDNSEDKSVIHQPPVILF